MFMLLLFYLAVNSRDLGAMFSNVVSAALKLDDVYGELQSHRPALEEAAQKHFFIDSEEAPVHFSYVDGMETVPTLCSLCGSGQSQSDPLSTT